MNDKHLLIRLCGNAKKYAVPFGCGLFFIVLLKFIFFIGYVPTASMDPAIKEGSIIFGVRTFSELRRGEIVVFIHDELLLVKRIAGIPGDTVYTENGSILTIPEGHYFMIGDNTADSYDSRHWDRPFVSHDNVVAVLLFIPNMFRMPTI